MLTRAGKDSSGPDPRPSARLLTYREVAQDLARGEDWHFAARLLRELALRSRGITAVDDVDEIHREPALTGVRGWDAIIGGVAHMTGRDRVSDASVLDWCFAPERYCVTELFDPFNAPEKYFWIDYLRTPVELQTRNVVFPAGNLEGF